jgi:predicted amidohydrolase
MAIPNLCGDAITAALLVEAAARSAASLVRINVAADAADTGLSPRAASPGPYGLREPVRAEGELVFWGRSLLVDPGGRMVAGASLYAEDLVTTNREEAGVQGSPPRAWAPEHR